MAALRELLIEIEKLATQTQHAPSTPIKDNNASRGNASPLPGGALRDSVSSRVVELTEETFKLRETINNLQEQSERTRKEKLSHVRRADDINKKLADAQELLTRKEKTNEALAAELKQSKSSHQAQLTAETSSAARVIRLEQIRVKLLKTIEAKDEKLAKQDKHVELMTRERVHHAVQTEHNRAAITKLEAILGKAKTEKNRKERELEHEIAMLRDAAIKDTRVHEMEKKLQHAQEMFQLQKAQESERNTSYDASITRIEGQLRNSAIRIKSDAVIISNLKAEVQSNAEASAAIEATLQEEKRQFFESKQRVQQSFEAETTLKNDLIRALNQAKDTIETFRKRETAKDREIDDMRKTLSASRDWIDTVEKSVKETDALRASEESRLKAQLLSKDSSIASLKSEIGVLKDKVADHMQLAEQTRSAMDSEHQLLLSQKKKGVEVEITLREQEAAAATALHRHEQELKRVSQVLEDREKYVKTLEETIEAAETNAKELSTRNAELVEKLITTQAEMHKKESFVHAAQKTHDLEVMVLQNNAKMLQASLDKKSAQLLTNSKALEQMETKLAAIEAGNQDEQVRVLVEAARSAEVEAAGLNATIAEKEQLIAELKVAAEHDKKSLEDVQSKINELKEDLALKEQELHVSADAKAAHAIALHNTVKSQIKGHYLCTYAHGAWIKRAPEINAENIGEIDEGDIVDVSENTEMSVDENGTPCAFVQLLSGGWVRLEKGGEKVLTVLAEDAKAAAQQKAEADAAAAAHHAQDISETDTSHTKKLKAARRASDAMAMADAKAAISALTEAAHLTEVLATKEAHLTEVLATKEALISELSATVLTQSSALEVFEETVSRLQASLQLQETEHATTKTSLENKDFEHAQVAQTLQAKEAAHVQVAQALQAKEAEHAQVVETLQAKETEHAQVVETLQAKEAEHAQVVETLQAKEAEHAAISLSLSKMCGEKNLADTQLEELKQELAVKNGKINELVSNNVVVNKAMATKLQDALAQVKSLNEAVASAECNKKEMDEREASLQQTISSLQAEQTASIAEIASLRTVAGDAENCDSKDETITQLEHDVLTRQRDLEECKAELQRKQEQMKEVEQSLNERIRELEASLEVTLTNAMLETNAKIVKENDLAQKLANSLQEIEELNAQQEADEDTIEQLQSGWKAQVLKDQAELAALKEQDEEEIDALKEQLQISQDELEELHNRYSFTAKELEIHRRHKSPPPQENDEVGIIKSGALLPTTSNRQLTNRKSDYDGVSSDDEARMNHVNKSAMVDTIQQQQQHDQVISSLREDHAEALKRLQVEHDTLLNHAIEENARKVEHAIHEQEQKYSTLLTQFDKAINSSRSNLNIQDMLTAVEEMKATVASQEHNVEEIAALHMNLESLQDEIRSKDVQLNELKHSVNLHAAMKDDLHEQHQASKAEKEEEISTLELVVAHLKGEMSQHSDKLAHHEMTHAEKEADLKSLQHIIEMLQSEVADKEAARTSAEVKLVEFQAAIQTLQTALQEQKADGEVKRARLDELSAELAAAPPSATEPDAAQQLADALQEIEELNAQQEADEDTIEQLQSGWKAQVLKDQAELAALKEQDEEEIAALQQELDGVEMERDHVIYMIEEIKIKIEEAVDEMTSLTALREKVLELVATIPVAENLKHVEAVRAHEEELASDADTPPASVVGHDSFDFTAIKVPIVHIEVGSFEMKLRVYDVSKEKFVLVSSCPSITASEKGGAGNHLTANSTLVQYASRFADPMFNYFRENGIFVGSDAQYCCFDHPDTTLRGKLVIDSQPIVDPSGRIVSQGRFAHLLKYLLNTGGYKAGSIQLVFSFFGCAYEGADARKVADVLFGDLQCNKVCFVQEHELALAAVYNQQLDRKLTVGSALLIQIGATRTTIVPVYESMVLLSAIRYAAVGGESITDLLDLMLHGQEDEGYMKLLPRRRKAIARAIKEQHVFACMGQESYDEALTRYGGAFAFDKIKVMPSAKNTSGNSNKRNNAKSARIRTDIDAQVDTPLPDGTSVNMVISKERFIAVEALFQPKLLRSALATDADSENDHGDQHIDLNHGIIDATLAAVEAIDADVRQDICSTIILSGASMKVCGLQERLKKELSENLAKYRVSAINVFADDIMINGCTTYVTHPDYSDVRRFVSGDMYHADADISELIL